MKKFTRLLLLGVFALAVASCTRPPPPPEGDLTPPRRAVDAKTELESGRR